MGWTRSIRRKMILGLGLVVVMLCVLLGNVVSIYRCYARAVDDFEFAVRRAPRRADLAEPIGMLFQPLLDGQPKTEADAKRQHDDFLARLEAAKVAFNDFVRKCEELPATPEEVDRAAVREAFLARIYHDLTQLDRTLVPWMKDVARRRDAYPLIMKTVASLQTSVQNMPSHLPGLQQRLQKSKTEFHDQFRVAGIAGIVVVVLFVGLFTFGFRSIFVPIRQLHEGARRVAQGNFDYRVDVPGRDEMADLAAAFNAMTARFREVRDDLDNEVEERSRQLVRSERLAGVGFLAAGVAHEINNPLSAISVAAESIHYRLPDLLVDQESEEAVEVREYLEMMQREAERCRGITGRLLDFARGQDEPRDEHDLATIVREVVAMVKPMGQFRDRHVVVRDVGRCPAEVNPGEIKQVVLNLVANGLEATESGGTLEVGLDAGPDRVVLTFRDDGCGMTPEVLEHLFDPFFTRRRGGKGTGLGLSITHRIVEDHGGSIEATSEGPDKGSTFRVVLPRRAAKERAA